MLQNSMDAEPDYSFNLKRKKLLNLNFLILIITYKSTEFKDTDIS